MFSLKVLLGEDTVPAVSTMVFAAVSGTVVSRFFLGDHHAFAVPLVSTSVVCEFQSPRS